MEKAEARHAHELAQDQDAYKLELSALQARINELLAKIGSLEETIICLRHDSRLEIPPISTKEMECSHARFVKNLHMANLEQLKCYESRFNQMLSESSEKNAQLLELQSREFVRVNEQFVQKSAEVEEERSSELHQFAERCDSSI